MSIEEEVLNKQKFIVWAPSYTEYSGGVYLLHYLCHYLNSAGYNAMIWHSNNLIKSQYSVERISISFLKEINRIRKGISKTSKLLNTPIATNKDLENSIVIYPETISDNPLCADKVVRWLLHIPGYFNSSVNYGENELYFSIQSAYIPKNIDNKVHEFYFTVMLESFKQTNFGPRHGTCFILRKGKNRIIYHNIDKDQIVDDLSHKEMAIMFNNSEYCISYDTQTFYSSCAAKCGCISIVIPEPSISKEEWRNEEVYRYGIAYGEDDINWAISTKNKMIDFLELQKKENLEKVNKFATICIENFR